MRKLSPRWYTASVSQRLIVFVSSTVQDLGAVRAEIRDGLEARQIEVRLSDSADFPVEPGVTSHDACLRAVREAHVFVLLVGCRFGGEYQGQNKSITWREWEEAMDAGLLPIVLVTKEANELAKRIFVRRRALVAEHPGEQVVDLDARLREEPEFRDQKPDRHNLPGVQRFIDVLRKGHVDNWMHADWDGSAEAAMRRIDVRLSSALAVSFSRARAVHEVAEAERLRTDAIHQVASGAAALSNEVRVGRASRERAVELLLALFVYHRRALLSFRDTDRYNFVVYFRDGETLRPKYRAAHPAIESFSRSWRVGQGHVGLAVEKNKLLVSGDIRNTAAWVPGESHASDRANYVSAVSAPFSFDIEADPQGVLIVTSDRLDHFGRPDQVEVLTIGTMLNMLLMLFNAGAEFDDDE